MDDLLQRWEDRKTWAWQQALNAGRERPFEVRSDESGRGMYWQGGPVDLAIQQITAFLVAASGQPGARARWVTGYEEATEGDRWVARLYRAQRELTLPLLEDPAFWKAAEWAGRVLWEDADCPAAPTTERKSRSKAAIRRRRAEVT